MLFRDDLAGRDLLFEAPSALIEAHERGRLRCRARREAEAARSAGKWLAGYFSYEAGYLFEPKLRPLLPEGRRAPLCASASSTVRRTPCCRATAAQPTNGPIFDARPAWSFADYEPRFRRVHRHLREGDCYQVNLTFPVDAGWTGDPLSAFAALTARQPVKYGALVSLGDPVVLSRSPELFFEIDAGRLDRDRGR